MKKIICIGELSLNMVLDHAGQPLASMSGSRVANAAAILARSGLTTLMAADAAADAVGDIVVSELAGAGVDVSTVDRYTEGLTPLNIYIQHPGAPATVTRYERYPDECFDIVWPRVNEDDVVLFGGFYAIDARMHARLHRFLEHAVERKAVLIYMPGFLPQLEPRITRVMPRILENLEMAHVVIARTADLTMIFGAADAATAYREHIDFYCRTLVAVEPDKERVCCYGGREQVFADMAGSMGASMLWNAGVAAGVASAIVGQQMTAADFEAPSAATLRALLAGAVSCATEAAARTRFPALGF